MPCGRVSHARQERSPRAGGGRHAVAAVRLHACPPSTQQTPRRPRRTHPRTHRSRSRRGRALLVLRGPDDDQGRRRGDRRPHDADRADRARARRLAAARPPQRGRVVLRPRGRAHDLGRGPDVVAPPAPSCSAPRRPAHVHRQLRRGPLPAGHAGGRVRGPSAAAAAARAPARSAAGLQPDQADRPAEHRADQDGRDRAHYPEVVVRSRSASPLSPFAVEYKLKLVFVSAIQQSGSADESTESVSLTYGAFEQNIGTNSRFGWANNG